VGGTSVFLFSFGLPAIGATAAWLATWASWKEVKAELGPNTRYKDESTPRARLMVFLVLPGTLLLFGYSAYVLISGRLGEIPDSILEWCALAFGIPGMLTGFGEAIVYRRGVAASFRHPSERGRVITLSVLPETAALFGFATSFLLLGLAGSFAGPPAVLADAARNSVLFVSLGAIGAPVTAVLPMTAYDYQTQSTFLRGVRRSVGGTSMMAVGFLLAYLAMAPLIA